MEEENGTEVEERIRSLEENNARLEKRIQDMYAVFFKFTNRGAEEMERLKTFKKLEEKDVVETLFELFETKGQ